MDRGRSSSRRNGQDKEGRMFRSLGILADSRRTMPTMPSSACCLMVPRSWTSSSPSRPLTTSDSSMPAIQRKVFPTLKVLISCFLPLTCASSACLQHNRAWPLKCYTGFSLAAFLLYWHDKRRARAQGWRVRERLLHLLALFGGWPGALVGMYYFEHKTGAQKRWFRGVLWFTILLHQVLWIGVLLRAPAREMLLRGK